MNQLLTKTAKKSALLACLSLIVGSGCTVKSRYIPVVVDGYWRTPSSEINFERTTLEKLRKRVMYDSRRSTSYALLSAHNEKYGVIINPYNTTSSIAIYGGEKQQHVTLDIESSFYSLSCEKEAPLKAPLISKGTTSYWGDYSDGQAALTLLDTIAVTEITDTRNLDNCKLRYYFSYQTLGEEYLIDVTIKFKKDTYIDWSDWHAPGMP